MIDTGNLDRLRGEVSRRMGSEKALLDQLRAEIRPLRADVRRILPRTTTSISLVGTDGGNNQIQFDPFLVHIVRVVDSSNNEYCLEVVTPTMSISALSLQQFDPDGSPRTALGRMMTYLGVRDLPQLSHMIRNNSDDRATSPSWIQVYRELVEWAILFDIVRTKDFGTDTLIVYDGLLRSKAFARDLFPRYLRGIQEGIEGQERKNRRKLFLAGVAKRSKVLTRYRLTMVLEGVLVTDFPAYVEVSRNLEENAYVWSEYARGDDHASDEGGEINKQVGGKMFFVKFGGGRRDPIWPIDVFLSQRSQAQMILGYMLADALNGFPIPFYPQCLQNAHKNAAMVGFDFDILQDVIFDGIRAVLGTQAPVLDMFRLQDEDPSAGRYG